LLVAPGQRAETVDNQEEKKAEVVRSESRDTFNSRPDLEHASHIALIFTPPRPTFHSPLQSEPSILQTITIQKLTDSIQRPAHMHTALHRLRQIVHMQKNANGYIKRYQSSQNPIYIANMCRYLLGALGEIHLLVGFVQPVHTD
jgi:hypothetical protein